MNSSSEFVSMGKKRAPLRKYLDSKGNISKDGDSRLAASGQDSRKKARRSEDTDSGVGSNVAHEDESSGEDSDDDIDLGGTIEEKIENFTFDFKDMHDDYVSSMRTLLMKHIVNPTKALNVALAMAEQGLLFFLCPVNRKLPHHLLKPEEVGTVVTSEDDREDVYAFISVLPVEKVQVILPIYLLTNLFDILLSLI